MDVYPGSDDDLIRPRLEIGDDTVRIVIDCPSCSDGVAARPVPAVWGGAPEPLECRACGEAFVMLAFSADRRAG